MGVYKRRYGKVSGFTLVEIMAVIAIITILMSIAIPQFIQYRQKGYNAEAKSDARNFYSCASAYATLNESVVFDRSNLPDAYTGRTMVGGKYTFDAGTRMVTCDATFRHDEGTITYVVDDNGNITEYQ
ncbi:MAG: type II secretion system protein [Deltaproteobacteria bacterium]|nr:type II secretion system protein [Deltaproteobacteria bacterium]